jgi:hypothetical protein
MDTEQSTDFGSGSVKATRQRFQSLLLAAAAYIRYLMHPLIDDWGIGVLPKLVSIYFYTYHKDDCFEAVAQS